MWSREDHIGPGTFSFYSDWKTNSDEVAFIQSCKNVDGTIHKILHLIREDGGHKTATVPICSDDIAFPKLWILQHVIMICCKTSLYLLDKGSLMISKVKYPKGFTFEQDRDRNDGVTSHFDAMKGVRFVIMQDRSSKEFRESDDNDPVIWFGWRLCEDEGDLSELGSCAPFGH